MSGYIIIRAGRSSHGRVGDGACLSVTILFPSGSPRCSRRPNPRHLSGPLAESACPAEIFVSCGAATVPYARLGALFEPAGEGRCRMGRLLSLVFSDVRLSSVRSAWRSVLFDECVFCRRSRAGSRARALNVFPDERIATIFLFSGKSLSLRARQSGHGSHKQTSINSLNVKKWSH